MSTPVNPGDQSATDATPDKPIPQPSLAEAYFFLNIIKFCKTKLDTDWDLVANESGFKNAETAKVRFGQIKKKLGFNNTTPLAARVKPGAKRGAADGDNDTGGPPEKKPRKTPAKTPAKPRGKKAQAAAAALLAASSPTAVGEESPLATKSKAACRDVKLLSSSLDPFTATGGNNGYTIKSKDDVDQDILMKSELHDEGSDAGNIDDDEEEQNARHKAALLAQIAQEKMRTGSDEVSLAFGPPDLFPAVDATAPALDGNGTVTKTKKGRTALPKGGQVRAATAKQAMYAAALEEAKDQDGGASTTGLQLATTAQGDGGWRSATPGTAGMQALVVQQKTFDVNLDENLSDDADGAVMSNSNFEDAFFGTGADDGVRAPGFYEGWPM